MSLLCPNFIKKSGAALILSASAFCFNAQTTQLSAQPALTITDAASDIATTPSEVKPLKVGEKAASAPVFTVDGKPLNLRDIYSSGPTVLLFYRGGWCPYCNTHLAKMAAIEDDLTSAGFQIVAISPDAPQFLRETAQKNQLNYTLLSDSSAQATRAFGLAFRVDDGTINRYLAFKNPIDLEKSSGESHHILPVPAAYIIDRNGVIKYAFWSPDYKQRVDENALLRAALDVQQQ